MTFKSVFKVCYSTIFFMGIPGINAQINIQQDKIWEKAAPETSRDLKKCADETLLNFNCNIREHFSQPIKYDKKNAQSLIVVHHSEETENIWYNKDVIAELNNNSFRKNENGKPVELKHKPSIFSYLSYKPNSNITKDILSIQLEDKNAYEALFIPQKIKKTDLERIHSYLSIKYGISLEGIKYFNSKGDVIWDPQKHKEFKNRPTGIGRDDANELYQKQSRNQEDKIMTIGREKISRTNFENMSPLDDNTFAIWSDDNNDLSFEEKKDLRILKRNWEINFIGKAIPKKGYVLQIDKRLMNPEDLRLNYWILIKNDDGSFQKIEGKAKENVIEYSGIEFPEEKESAVFTFATNIAGDKESNNNSAGQNPIYTKGPGDASSDLQYMLYPNPVKMNNYVTVKFPATDDLEISIYDGGGRIISSEKVSSTSVTYQSKFNMQGIYLVTLTQNKKLIKAFKVIVE
ncbi:hypothetical protein HNP38_001174 [Chryseobacterium defluvii]|uniref:Secreted protein (Por secretion system target) n=1 Tax=Chryseobacterium defluvii TaxID=160396 RepID=A0A840KG41_9FLAO|nr:T9SS type A sorting domain-containing protein [Chryseobacterium defluvii]MBB4805902.1 hypothetical protein [Chryseobacterium defluvii]